MEGDTEKKWGAETEGKVIQRLPTCRHIPYTVTKPRHYCGCQQLLADRSLIQLSPERFCQCLTNTEVDTHSCPLDWVWVPNGRAIERAEGAEGACIGGTTIWTNQFPQSSQGLNHQPKCTHGGTHGSSCIFSRGWPCGTSVSISYKVSLL